MMTLVFGKDALPKQHQNKHTSKELMKMSRDELLQWAKDHDVDFSPTTSKGIRMALFKTFTKEDFNNWCIDNNVTQYTIRWEDFFLEWRKASTQ
ncbi:hypothetical protein VCRA2128O305_10057 [Vibrio crassostreae]|uniref:hypothetical protein n=1 Tax=Vibrio crassostreae TaxID=246167 RepID=UPI0005E7314B|nr:hypothetical protein [Vibrio crassostreae]RPF10736.1 hypothetical protein EDB14_1828 [Vibrio crassostreae]TCT67640.1 hypothetical protein EDB44_101688 [Vibrio crassostreae]TCT86929.1 hypothetical protein EDB43_10154 [Vibrio crassostreae]TCU07888.1 hypothetical protein EDB47_10254 [Vibrio crassostreae]TDW13294.1 hypothetical protein EDB45_10153 [Vibrio crassostreae]